MRRFGVGIVTALLLLQVGPQAQSAKIRSFLIKGNDEFRKGKSAGVALLEEGSIRPGLQEERVAEDLGDQVWSLLRMADGTLFAASGSDGEVYRLAGQGVREVIDSDEVEIFALTQGPEGQVYAAGAPSGAILQVAGPGAPRLLFDPPENLVWALQCDGRGNLYAGTGESGALYRIESDGTARVLYRAEDQHLAVLEWGPAEKLLVGTSGRGLLLEVDPSSGKAEVLYDATWPEITAITFAPSGEIYFATSSGFGSEPFPGRGEEREEKTGEVDGEKGEGARLYLFDRENGARLVWTSEAVTIHDLAIDAEGRLLVGTGDPAALYRIESNLDATLLWRPESGQVLALAIDHGSILAGTGNPGAVYRIGPDRAQESWIEFEPLDAGTVARWGRASWQVDDGSGQWALRTRTGQTEKPDSSWSDWSRPLDQAAGSVILSPPARYLQCEARFGSGSSEKPARLRQIWIPFSEPNLPPRIKRIGFSADPTPSGDDSFDAGSFTQDLGAGLRVEIQQSGEEVDGEDSPSVPPWTHAVRSVYWVVGDPNGDRLRFDVGIRKVGESRFRTLVEDHEMQAYAIDTRTLPDGEYEVRVRATDSGAHPEGEGLEAVRISNPFRVDHGSPDFEGLTARRVEGLRLLVEGRVHDAVSPIRQLEISWDGRGWQPAASRDGILDGPEEEFRVEIKLEDEKEGSWVAVRASDTNGNSSIGRVWLQR